MISLKDEKIDEITGDFTICKDHTNGFKTCLKMTVFGVCPINDKELKQCKLTTGQSILNTMEKEGWYKQ